MATLILDGEAWHRAQEDYAYIIGICKRLPSDVDPETAISRIRRGVAGYMWYDEDWGREL